MQSINKSYLGSAYVVCYFWLQNATRCHHCHPSPCHLHLPLGHHGCLFNRNPCFHLLTLLPLQSSQSCPSKLQIQSHHFLHSSFLGPLISIGIKSKPLSKAHGPSAIGSLVPAPPDVFVLSPFHTPTQYHRRPRSSVLPSRLRERGLCTCPFSACKLSLPWPHVVSLHHVTQL